jgi:hypothetical protein
VRHELLRATVAEPVNGPPGLVEYRLLDEDTRAALEHAGGLVQSSSWQLAVFELAERDPGSYLLHRPAVTVAVSAAGALVAAHRGDRETAVSLLRVADGGSVGTLAVLHAARATLAELADRPKDALDELMPLLDVEEMPPFWFRWLPGIARLMVRTGDRNGVARLARIGDGRSLPVEARMLTTYCRGILAENPDEIRAVISYCRATDGLGLMHAHALADLAWLLARRGAAREAQEVLGDALARLRAIGAEADRRRAEAGVEAPALV